MIFFERKSWVRTHKTSLWGWFWPYSGELKITIFYVFSQPWTTIGHLQNGLTGAVYLNLLILLSTIMICFGNHFQDPEGGCESIHL